jgi:hypothetical protein
MARAGTEFVRSRLEELAGVLDISTNPPAEEILARLEIARRCRAKPSSAPS